MREFDYQDFQKEQSGFFERYLKIYEKHRAIFEQADPESLSQAWEAQKWAQEMTTEWARGGCQGPAPFAQKPDLGPVGDLLKNYAVDIKAALGVAKVYTCLPSYGLPPMAELKSGKGVPVAHMDRATDGVFAATGKDVLDYCVRAAAGDGYLSVSPDGTGFGADPVESFDSEGNALFSRTAHVYEFSAEHFEPEVALVKDSQGHIVPGPFNHEWTAPGPVKPLAVYEAKGMSREYFANIDVWCRSRNLSDASARAAGTTVLLNDAEGFLLETLDGAAQECGATVSAELDPSANGGRTAAHSDGSYGIELGTKALHENARHGWARDQDLAWAAKCAFHETRHLYQKEAVFQGDWPLSEKELHMSVMEACAAAYPGYDADTYAYRLDETDAEREGIHEALAALSIAFPDTDWEAAMLEAYNGRDQAFDDRRLNAERTGAPFDGASVPRTRAYQPGIRYDSLDEVCQRLDALDQICVGALHGSPCVPGDAVYDKNAWDQKFLDLLQGDGTKAGLERDRELLASALQARVLDFDKMFPAMKGELDKIRLEHGVETDAMRSLRKASCRNLDCNGKEEGYGYGRFG